MTQAKPRENNVIRTQWGSLARPFSSYTPAERARMLTVASELLSDITRDTGIECFLSYGALLGAVRSGELIGHDFDLDAVFVAPSSQGTIIAATSRRLAAYLLQRGCKLDLESNGQIKAHWQSEGREHKLEFFVGWVKDNAFYQYFAVQGADIADQIFPLASVVIEGVEFAAPRRPEALLEAIYGPNWRIPDPDFKYQLSPEDWIAFKFLFLRKNQQFWNAYYEERERNRVFVKHPSQFCIFVADQLDPQSLVLDFGCGNGRDGLYLASSGFQVTLADYSQKAIDYCLEQARNRSLDVRATTVDICDVAQSFSYASKNREAFDAVYARFLLHAIDEIAEENFLRMSFEVLTQGGRLFAEYRVEEPGRPAPKFYENGDHYRRLIRQDDLVAAAASCGFEVEYSTSGRGLANYKSEDPLIGRLVLVKPGSVD